MNAAVLVALMALVTILLRALPFLIFHKHIPEYISFLGQVLPPAIIGMLVIYCLKDISFFSRPFGIPELIASGIVVGLQVLKRNSLVSILGGTFAYMVIVRLAF